MALEGGATGLGGSTSDKSLNGNSLGGNATSGNNLGGGGAPAGSPGNDRMGSGSGTGQQGTPSHGHTGGGKSAPQGSPGNDRMGSGSGAGQQGRSSAGSGRGSSPGGTSISDRQGSSGVGAGRGLSSGGPSLGGGAGAGRGSSPGGPSLGGREVSGAGAGRGTSIGGPSLGTNNSPSSERFGYSPPSSERFGGGPGVGAGRGTSIGGPSLGTSPPSAERFGYSPPSAERFGGGFSGAIGPGAGRGNSIGGPSLGTSFPSSERFGYSPPSSERFGAGAGRGTSIGGPSLGTSFPSSERFGYSPPSSERFGQGAGRGNSIGGPSLTTGLFSSGRTEGANYGPGIGLDGRSAGIIGPIAERFGGANEKYGRLGSSISIGREGMNAGPGVGLDGRSAAGMTPTTPSPSMDGPSFRSTEIASLNSMRDFGTEVVGVIDAGKGWTTVELRNGTIERRTGNRNTRNNNPGNIEYGKWAKSKGAIGTDSRFAVFPSVQAGKNAIGSLIFEGKRYAGKTVAGAIAVYAPAFENNTKSYANSVATAAGVSVNTPMADLTTAQRAAMVDAMVEVEGGKAYKSSIEKTGNWQSRSATASFADKYLTQQQVTDIPASTVPGAPSASTVPGAPSASTPATKDKPSSLARTIGSTAIDIGGSMIPGVGIALGIVNGGLALTGNDTIGERIYDGLTSGDRSNAASPTVSNEGAGSGTSSRPNMKSRVTATKDVGTAATKDVVKSADVGIDRFISKYLNVNRQTPAEKWGRRVS